MNLQQISAVHASKVTWDVILKKEPLKNQITSFKDKSDQVNEDKNLLSKHLEKLVCNPIIDDCKFLSNNVQTFLLVSITILYPAKL